MLVFLIGPSGVGKSTIAASAMVQRPDIRYVELDAVIRAKDNQLFNHNGDRWEDFWSLAVRCIKDIEKEYSGISLVDCGAGCLQTDQALLFFQSAMSTIAFIGTPAVLFDRAKKSKPYWQNRTLHEYQEGEFSDRNQKFYSTAKFKVDVSKLSEQEAVNSLLAILNKMALLK